MFESVFYCVRSHPFTVAYGLISSSVARPGGYIAKLYIFCLVYIFFWFHIIISNHIHFMTDSGSK